MKPTMRLFQHDDDYWRIRAFLREVFLRNNRRELSWQVYRFDYWRWHGVENMGHGRLEEEVFIWELPDKQIAAVLNREAPGHAYVQVHPELRNPDLENEMLDVAEEHLAVPGSNGGRKLKVWTNEQDTIRQKLLVDRGYTKGTQSEFQRRRPVSQPVPDVPLAEGYTVRALGDVEEMPARSYVSWRAFHPDEPAEQFKGWEWYHNIQRAPLYRRDLDIVAVAPDGKFASFCTIWFDDVTRTAAFEPVGTAPEHQKRGLGKAVMYEGLRRLKRLGATLAFVGSGSPGAHALYSSVGFTDYDISEPWIKEW